MLLGAGCGRKEILNMSLILGLSVLYENIDFQNLLFMVK